MTREEAISVLYMVEAHGLADEAKRMAIKALQAEIDGDLISRADAVAQAKYLVNRWIGVTGKAYEEKVPLIEEVFNAIPSADRPSGEWKQITPARIYDCSNCGHYVLTDDIEEYNYCPNCGAKMGSDVK